MPSRNLRGIVAIWCASALLPGEAALVLAQEKPPAPAPAPAAAPAATPEAPAATKLTADQLDSLVAPIALYPDPLLAQTLVAATYPLEIVQLQQWLAKNPKLKDKELADAVAKQPWEVAIQSMAAVPEVVKRLSDDIQWTTDLGNAFLAQQAEVMDAVQRMRKKATDSGALKTNEQQKVETKVVEEKTVIVVESANPEVVYVPSYSPVVVYGPPVYPYPPIYYPPYPPGGAFISFSFGVMWGAAIWGGSCCGCGWGGNDIDINVNNNFNRVNHREGGNRGDGNRGDGNRGGAGGGSRGPSASQQPRGGAGGGGGGKWQHNPQHRGAAPYGDKATANKFGGNTRGPSASQQPRGGGSGAGGGSRGPSASQQPRGGAGGGGGDRIGSRDIPKSSASSRSGGFSGGSRGYSGSSARSSSSRGASSMGSRGGGGRGGGGGRRR